MLDPFNRQLNTNLEFANSRIQGTQSSSATERDQQANPLSVTSLLEKLTTANRTLTALVGDRILLGILAISSLLFWGLLIGRAWGAPLPVVRLAILPLVILILAAASLGLTHSHSNRGNCDGILVVNTVDLRSGDGEQFEPVVSLESSEGQRVEILGKRGGWTQIRTGTGQSGWVKAELIEDLRLDI